jgi:hypothetical protein
MTRLDRLERAPQPSSEPRKSRGIFFVWARAARAGPRPTFFHPTFSFFKISCCFLPPGIFFGFFYEITMLVVILFIVIFNRQGVTEC